MSINLASWKEVSKTARDDIKKEVLKYFIIRNKDDLNHAGRAALLIAGKAWKQWKSKLVMEYARVNITPFAKFPQIKEDAWAEFVREKNSEEFKLKSLAARELALKYTNHHKMGTAGYAGMSIVWAKEDLEA